MLTLLAVSGFAQAPGAINGDAFLAQVTAGVYPPFNTGGGYFLFVPANSGNSYHIVGVYITTGGCSGTYTYTPASSTNATLIFNSTCAGLVNVNASFTSATTGSYKQTAISYPGAFETGNFTTIATSNSVSSVAGKTFALTITDGYAPFQANGSYLLFIAASGTSYTTSLGSSGTCAFSLVNRSTGQLQVNDSFTGSSTYYFGFTDSSSGGFANTQLPAADNGFQVGNFAIIANPVPSINLQPQPQTVQQGQPAAFSVTTSGTPPMSYQWRFNGTNLSGAKTNFYTISSAQPSNAGSYTVVITNIAGAVTSAPALLTVLPNIAPSITVQPLSQSTTQGLSAAFSVMAGGTAPLAYLWRCNGTNLAAGNAAICPFASAQPSNAGVYTVVITNVAGAVTSTPAWLTVTPIANTGLNGVLSLVGGGYLTVPNATDLQNSNQITIEAWIYPANSNAMWLSKGDGSDCCSDRSFDWHFFGNEMDIAMFWSNNVVVDFVMPMPALSNWIHLAAVYSSKPGLYQIYTNGVLARATTTNAAGLPLAGLSLRQSTRPLTIGQDPYWYTADAVGCMDEVRIWNTARTAQQIRQNMACKLTGVESNLIAYWNFDDGTATDQTKNGHNGTLAGTANVVPLSAYDAVHAGCIRLHFSSVGLTADYLPSIFVTGPTGVNVRVDTSTNLLLWTPLITLPNRYGTIQFIDPDAPTIPRRFYRAVSP